MPPWIPLALVAALFQTWRTALQQKLRGQFSVGTASLFRYVYGVPVGLAFLTVYCLFAHVRVPAPTPGFVLGCAIGGLGQVMGTALLIMAFGHRNFTVGTAYSKTDAVQAAILALLLFHQALPGAAWIGIGVGVAGVLVLSLAGKGFDPMTLLRATVQPAALCGLGAGTGFAVAGIAIKAATESLGVADKVLEALFALVVTNTLQTLMQGGWMLWRDRAGLVAAFVGWRRGMWVGAMSAAGSACWFAGFTMAPVALVRTVGQVEMGFTLLFSRYYLRETLRRTDVAGLGLVVLGVILVLVVR